MFIKRSVFQQDNSTGDWIVKGRIGIEGEFSREEWERLREAFIALGLFQVQRNAKPPSECIPSRQECVAAVQDYVSGRDYKAWQKVCEKYNLPDGSIFNISTGQLYIPPKIEDKTK